MENPRIESALTKLVLATHPHDAVSPHFTRVDLDRARRIADDVISSDPAIRDVVAIASFAVPSACSLAERGERPDALAVLARGLVATSLAAWQWNQLATEAAKSRNFSLGQARRAEAEKLLRLLPGQANVSASLARSFGSAESEVLSLRAVLLAFVAGSGVARSLLGEDAANGFIAAIDSAFDVEPNVAVGANLHVGVPRLSSNGDRRRGQRGTSAARPALSTREQEVLCLIVGGQTTAEIAYRLGVKTTTVATLVGRMFNKLGVNNRPAAVGVALRYGLCSMPDEGAA